MLTRADVPLSPLLGARLRHARLAVGLTLKQVGKRIGTTEGYISKLEHDRARPSVGTLHALAQVLQTNVNALFEEPVLSESPVAIVRGDRRPSLTTGNVKSRPQVNLEKLIPSGPKQLLQVNIHVVAPQQSSGKAIRHAGQEFGYVLKGALTLVVDGASYELKEGDAFSFASHLLHHYRNASRRTSHILWVNTPPTF